MQLSKLIFLTVLIIFNHIIFTNSESSFGGSGLYSFFTGDKLYFYGSIDLNFFYVDLAGISLDTDTVIDESKWIDLTEIRPQPDILVDIPLLDKANVNLIILDFDIEDTNAYRFHTTSNRWEVKPDKVKEIVSVVPGDWVSDEKTGMSYSFREISEGITIFDSINLTLTKGVSTPKNLFVDKFIFGKGFVQVLLNGRILFIGGGFASFKNSMNSILMYDTITDTWQLMVLFI
jgi:hypothetical protein